MFAPNVLQHNVGIYVEWVHMSVNLNLAYPIPNVCIFTHQQHTYSQIFPLQVNLQNAP